MAPEENGKLTEARSSLDLFEDECVRRGWHVTRVPAGLSIEIEGLTRLFPWPLAPPIRKSAIPSIARASRYLRAVPTQACEPELTLELPVCVKPNVGSLGVGFLPVHSVGDWTSFVTSEARLGDFVVQPLLVGTEHRVTLCGNRTFAMADLIERWGTLSQWNDSTATVPREWLQDLHHILGELDVPVTGADIIESEGHAYLLDINLAPDLAVHLAAQPPRDLAPAVLDSWHEVIRTGPLNPSPQTPFA